MLTWHSPSSFWTDMVFGVAPAVLFVFMSAYALVVAVVFTRNDAQNPEVLGLYALAVPGFVSSLSLMYSSFARDGTRFKHWVIASLALGLLCAAYLAYFLVFRLGFRNDLLVFLLPALSVALVAAKHIVLLSRATRLEA